MLPELPSRAHEVRRTQLSLKASLKRSICTREYELGRLRGCQGTKPQQSWERMHLNATCHESLNILGLCTSCRIPGHCQASCKLQVSLLGTIVSWP
jgi:hypothetical protein